MTFLLRPLIQTGAAAALSLTLWLIVAAGPALADAKPVFDQKDALATSQAAIGRKLSDHRLVDRKGHPVRFSDFVGKPLILSLIYTSCYHTCPQITQSLAQAAQVAADALGEDKFSIITIGFDADYDKPNAMRTFAREQGISEDNWKFLSADARTIWRLSDEVGFRFEPSAKGFDHLTQTTVIDGEGRVYAQVYGDDIATPHLVEPLKQLVFNGGPWTQAASLMDRIRLFCTVYDPARDAYRFDYSLFIGMAIGTVCLILIFGFVAREFFFRRPPPSPPEQISS